MSAAVDVVIVAALLLEYEKARDALAAGIDGMRVARWVSQGDNVAPYLVGDLARDDGTSLRIALGRPTRIGTNATSSFAATLVERLKPFCLAMTGVCAGNPSDVALGDVIVAAFTYMHDEGKRTEKGFQGDFRQFSVPQNWVREAQELSADGLPSYGDASHEDAERWLLQILHNGVEPRFRPARRRYIADDSWTEIVQDLEQRRLILRDGDALKITAAGQDAAQKALAYDVASPSQLPFGIVTGPMASGNMVVKDGLAWEALKHSGSRSTIGLDMEAAAIGSLADLRRLDAWVVIKGVMDHADPKKDDRYKAFAARASAEVLVRLLARVMPFSAKDRGPISPSAGSESSEAGNTGGNDRAPALSIAFHENRTSQCVVRLSQVVTSIDAPSLEEVKRDTPLLAVPAVDPPWMTRLPRGMAGFGPTPPPSQWTRAETEVYNGWVESYYAQWEKYLVSLKEWSLVNQRTLDVALILINDGSAPATDIDVDLIFPSTLALFRHGEGPRKPRKPEPPPIRPMRRDEGLASLVEPEPLSLPPFGVKPSNFVDPENGRVYFQQEKLKHGRIATINTFRVSFPNACDIGPISVDYIISAVEPVSPITGQLQFDIEVSRGEPPPDIPDESRDNA